MKHTRYQEIAEDKKIKGAPNYSNINIKVILALSMQELDINFMLTPAPNPA